MAVLLATSAYETCMTIARNIDGGDYEYLKAVGYREVAARPRGRAHPRLHYADEVHRGPAAGLVLAKLFT